VTLISSLDTSCTRRLQNLGSYDNISRDFSNWNEMSLKEDLKLNRDFVLATDATWLKLAKVFGGGVKIGISLVDTKEDSNLR